VGELFAYFSKLAIHRIRPDNPVYFEDSFSFPSGHAVVAMIFYGFLGYFLIRKLAHWTQKAVVFVGCFTIIAAIGLSRLYLGVHYLSDVFGGYLLGFLVLLATIMVYEWKRSKKNSTSSNAFIATRFVKIATAIVCIAAILGYIAFTVRFWPLILSQ
jgi:undecaprenyl-diphosphatase